MMLFLNRTGICSLFVVLMLTMLSMGAVAQTPSFQEVFLKHQSIMLLIDPVNGEIVDANDSAGKFYGYAPAQLRAMSIQQINTLTPAEVAAERKLATEENRNYFIFRHRLANGEIRTVEVASVPFMFDRRKLLFSIVSDITEKREAEDALWHYQSRLEQMVEKQANKLRNTDRNIILLLLIGTAGLLAVLVGLLFNLRKRKRAEKLLHIERERLEEIIRGANIGTWEWNVATGRARFNARWAEILGYQLEELNADSIDCWFVRLHPEDRERSQRQMQKYFAGELSSYKCEARMRHKAGHWIWAYFRGVVVERQANGKPLRMVGTQQDITARKVSYDDVQYQANYDYLTKLPNRALGYDRCQVALKQAQRNGEGVFLLFVDLDGFKPVNDSKGHESGDLVLQQVGRRLEHCIRSMDTVFRFGGDEFVVLISGVNSRTTVIRVSNEILRSVSQPYELPKGDKVKIACSIGIAEYPTDGGSVEELLKQADGAMYKAKRNGKNGYHFVSDELINAPKSESTDFTAGWIHTDSE